MCLLTSALPAAPQINYNPGFNTTVRALHNFQKWQPTMDRRFGWVYSINPVPGGRYQLTVSHWLRSLSPLGDPGRPTALESSRLVVTPASLSEAL